MLLHPVPNRPLSTVANSLSLSLHPRTDQRTLRAGADLGSFQVVRFDLTALRRRVDPMVWNSHGETGRIRSPDRLIEPTYRVMVHPRETLRRSSHLV